MIFRAESIFLAENIFLGPLRPRPASQPASQADCRTAGRPGRWLAGRAGPKVRGRPGPKVRKSEKSEKKLEKVRK